MALLARFSFSVAVGLLLLECCLQVYNPLPMRVRGDRIVLPVLERYRFDNAGATKLDPVTVHTKNSLGFRGPEPPRGFADRLTIITVGGSTTECLFLSDGRTWTDVLAARIAPAFPGAWVNNAGLDGHSTFGHLVLLRTFLTAIKPRVIVYLIGINDVGIEASNTFDAGVRPAGGFWRSAVATLGERLETAALAINLVRATRARERGFGHSQVDLTTATMLALDADVMDRTIAGMRSSIAGFEQRVRRLVAETREAGILPVLVTQPALYGDTIDPVTGVSLVEVQVNGRGNGHLEWRILELYNDVTRRVAGEQAVALIDLAHALPKDSRFFYDFLHFTNEGAQRVGEIVAAGLLPHLRAQMP